MRALLQVRAEQVTPRAGRVVPLLVKIAPDLERAQLEAVCALAMELQLDGLIISNTTLAPPDSLRSPHCGQQGGLSGKPLFAPSTQGHLF